MFDDVKWFITWQGQASKLRSSQLREVYWPSFIFKTNPKPQTHVYEGEQAQTFQEDSGRCSIMSKIA